MQKRYLVLIAFFYVLNLEAKEISFSFDDAPRGNGQYFSGQERTNRLIQELKKAGVKRVGFYVNTKKFDKRNGLKRIQQYKQAGHLIGSHTHSHINIREASAQDYLKDFNKAHRILLESNLIDYYFRYPFLRRGKTLDEVNEIHNHVLGMSYVDAFVTVDNYDFYMEDLFQKSLRAGKDIDYKNLKKFYVETLYKGIKFYDDLAVKALGKPVKHVMLLHENDLAALFIGDLVSYLKSKGWKVIPPEESYSDPVTKHFPSTVLNHGSGRVNSLAIEAGYGGPTNSGLESTQVLDKLFIDYKVIK